MNEVRQRAFRRLYSDEPAESDYRVLGVPIPPAHVIAGLPEFDRVDV